MRSNYLPLLNDDILHAQLIRWILALLVTRRHRFRYEEHHFRRWSPTASSSSSSWLILLLLLKSFVVDVSQQTDHDSTTHIHAPVFSRRLLARIFAFISVMFAFPTRIPITFTYLNIVADYCGVTFRNFQNRFFFQYLHSGNNKKTCIYEANADIDYYFEVIPLIYFLSIGSTDRTLM